MIVPEGNRIKQRGKKLYKVQESGFKVKALISNLRLVSCSLVLRTLFTVSTCENA